MFVIHRISRIGAVAVLAAVIAAGQDASSDQTQPREQESKRILWIVPNYRTFPSLVNYEPLTPAQKFKLATQDSFDRGTVALAALFAGEAQLTNSNRSFGQGVAGYSRYFGTAYGDLRDRQLHVRGGISLAASPGPALLPARHR